MQKFADGSCEQKSFALGVSFDWEDIKQAECQSFTHDISKV